MPNTASSANSFLHGSMSSLKSRRPSMLTGSNASMHSTHLSGANTSGILQQLGTGVVRKSKTELFSCSLQLSPTVTNFLRTFSQRINTYMLFFSTNYSEGQSKPETMDGVVTEIIYKTEEKNCLDHSTLSAHYHVTLTVFSKTNLQFHLLLYHHKTRPYSTTIIFFL